MSGINMKGIFEKYFRSPNNILSEVKMALCEKGFTIPSGNKGRISLHDGMYTLSATSAKLDIAEIRQFDASLRGLVTVWLRDGNLYKYGVHELSVGRVSREMPGTSYMQATARNEFDLTSLLDPRIVKSSEEYNSDLYYAILKMNDYYQDMYNNMRVGVNPVIEDEENYFIYIYYDRDMVLYVGQTTDVRRRYAEHRRSSEWFRHHTMCKYVEVENKTMMHIYEIYYINKLNPVHNISMINGGDLPFELPELEFANVSE